MASRRDSAGSQGGAHSRIVASSGTIEAAPSLIRVIATELDGGPAIGSLACYGVYDENRFNQGGLTYCNL
jgi:hypothetical protein